AVEVGASRAEGQRGQDVRRPPPDLPAKLVVERGDLSLARLEIVHLPAQPLVELVGFGERAKVAPSEEHRLEDAEQSEAEAAGAAPRERVGASDPRQEVDPAGAAERDPAAQEEDGRPSIRIRADQADARDELVDDRR